MMNARAEAMARWAAVQVATDALRAASDGVVPRVLVVLGSGLEGVIEALDVAATLPFAELPGFPAPTVKGHAGRFVFGHAADVPVLAMQGRVHLYEGHRPEQVVLPVRAAKLLGADTLVVTNAAGGLHPDRQVPGDIVLLRDQINLQGTTPLAGPNIDEIGPRFPVMAGAFDDALAALARDVAAEQGTALAEGVYAGLLGPAFETPAEVAMLRTLGADVVGMSTVAEVIAARHCGLKVLGFSLVTNVAGTAHGHDDVLAAGAAAAPVLGRLVAGILTRL